MILRPVRPQSPAGPPMTKRPVGLIRKRVSALIISLGSTGLMTSSMTAGQVGVGDVRIVLGGHHHRVDRHRLAVHVLHGELALASGRSHGRRPSFRTSPWRCMMRWA